MSLLSHARMGTAMALVTLAIALPARAQSSARELLLHAPDLVLHSLGPVGTVSEKLRTARRG